MTGFILWLYALPLAFILGYSLIQFSLALTYFFNKRKGEILQKPQIPTHWPKVTIQLPLYNERYVVERLIDCIAKIDYPREQLQIQVLDDSTDETTALVEAKIKALKATSLQIELVRRPERKGFKAGALAYGLQSATGEFVAIFDADFLPNPDFLKNTIPHFQEENVGVVQTRWGHINEEQSLLTRLQAFALDAHFSVEQKGRNLAEHFINFNGTAGVWRRATIDDAGGWQADTLTEDLDLSYRAQLKKWKFVYREDLITPAELPVAMSALKSQQFRWTKGAAECARKNLGKVLKDKEVGLSHKFHAVFHLLNSFIFISILSMSLLSIPVVFIKANLTEYSFVFDLASYMGYSYLFLGFFFFMAYLSRRPFNLKTCFSFLAWFPVFMIISLGLSLHNGIAALEGYIGKKSPFVRTPKFGADFKTNGWKRNKYLIKSIGWLTWVEILLTSVFTGLVFYDIQIGEWGLLPFHIMLVFGYGTISFYSVRHIR